MTIQGSLGNYQTSIVITIRSHARLHKNDIEKERKTFGGNDRDKQNCTHEPPKQETEAIQLSLSTN